RLAITIGFCRSAGHRHAQKLARRCDALGLGGAREEAVMANAMEALRQDMDEEATDELAGGKRHGGVTGRSFDTVVLDPEGHARGVGPDEATVRDGDPVGVAGQISEHGLGTREWTLGIDVPALLSERTRQGAECQR